MARKKSPTNKVGLKILTMKSTGTFDLQTISKTIESMTIKFPFYRVTFSSKELFIEDREC
jgi:hypothetical protein